MPGFDRAAVARLWAAGSHQGARSRWREDDGTPRSVPDLNLPVESGELPSREPDRSIWAWRGWFPVSIDKPISLGEGGTPLVAAPWVGDDVWLKLDHLNPTGSFKDRGAALVVSALRQAGATRLLEDSSGNAGTSLAAYAAAAGLQARLLVPENTSTAKVALARAYGTDVVIVPGDRQATATEAARQASLGWFAYASHTWHPLFAVGVATQALEIWQQLGGRAPATVVVVAGGGSMVLGHDLAWRALLAAGLIDALPKLVMVQPQSCAPLVQAWASGQDDISETVTPEPTLAEGTAVARPVRADEVLAALRRLDGVALATDEVAIAEATRALAAHGQYVEPTSANALAGWRQLVASHQVDVSGTTVIVLTGSGLKAPNAMRAIFGG